MIHNSHSTAFKLSAIVITRNEEHDIEACLASVKGLVDELIVVDSGSTDRTVEIAKQFTPNVFHNAWTGYSAQKQFALEKAVGEWVLNIDADERVSEALAGEIKRLLFAAGETSFKAYRIPYRHYFRNHRLRFGGVQGETHIRLFRRNSARYGDEKIHEGIRIDGALGTLKAPIDHQSYRNIEEYLNKCNSYTSLISEKKFRNGQRFHWWHHLRLPLEFVKRYVFRLGFLDGGAGLTYALLSSYYVWLKFVKLDDYKEPT